MSREFKVAVVLVNYNSSQHTINCVESIYKNTSLKIPFEIIIVDNNSQAEDYKKLHTIKKLKNLKIIRNKINTGFASGCMHGVQHADADYYFFLNNDCILMNDCITILTRFLETHESASICSPQLYNDQKQPTTSFDYRPDLSSKILGKYYFKISRGPKFISRKIIPKEPVQVEVLSGSQLFVRAIDFESLGGFDTTLFLYCEEEDLAYRAHKADMELWLVPEAKNSHIGGASTPQINAINQEFLISFFYFYEKHYGKFKTIVLRIIYAARYLRKSFKDPKKINLFWFILNGSHMKYSLRHVQKINNLDNTINTEIHTKTTSDQI